MFLGVDLGGTNLKIGVINSSGELLYHQIMPTKAQMGFDALYERIQEQVLIPINKFPEIKSIGFGIPGVVDYHGKIISCNNLSGWVNINIQSELENKFQRPVRIDNDANAACIAELELGVGKDIKSFIYITLGTGVGGAIVFDRKLFRGETGAAGEIGYIIQDCNAKLKKENNFQTGILESFVGKNQITDYAYKIMEKYPNSFLKKYPRPDPYFISEALKYNDAASIEIFYNIGRQLGMGISSAMNILDISNVIIGGGLSLSHEFLLATVRDTIRQRAIPSIAERANLVVANFTKDAGVIGAALLGKSALEN